MITYHQWGSGIEAGAIQQMENACSLPVSVAAALMPDAHVGYGLPIGGVLATRNCVIPYAVGVDIACRMKLTAYDADPDHIGLTPLNRNWFRTVIEDETRFGIGCEFKERREHSVMDEDWTVSPVTAQLKDKAWAQLGTSGSGNHFVEFGCYEDHEGLTVRSFSLALLTHSGSRGVGAAVCNHYSKIAAELTIQRGTELPQLGWLDLDSAEGQEYWAAMELMGKYASANHELIHRHIAKRLELDLILDIENHHNFAWKETHGGEELIVHRKGATPAGSGQLGIIPGSMAAPGFVVRGRGDPRSLNSASHGAGRAMSRKKAKAAFHWSDVRKDLEYAGVTLISGGLDEVPGAYKDIHTVMDAQTDLIEVVGRFDPRLVKMAPSGEPAED